ncbi:MAG: hypothetical protein AAGI70_05145, partial [Pseudomonadota bacterium]
ADFKVTFQNMRFPPPYMGVHPATYGLSLGLQFTPPGLDIGILGSYYIGDDKTPQPDEFALIFEMVEEVPDILFLSFYANEISLPQAVTMVSNQALPGALDVLKEIKVSDLSFYWCESIVTLPDATQAQPLLGFSGAIELASFSAQMALELKPAGGQGASEISFSAQMAPINLRDILHVAGDGKAVTKKIVTDGEKPRPVKNNTVTPWKSQGHTTLETLVPAGGPVAAFDLMNAPFVHLSAEVSLFDLVKEKIQATVSVSGVSFSLDYSALRNVEDVKLACTLDSAGFDGESDFSCAFSDTVGPLKRVGIDIGSLKVDGAVDGHVKVSLTEHDFGLTLSGKLDVSQTTGLGGLPKLEIPSVTLSTAPQSLESLADEIAKQIRDEAQTIFEDAVSDAKSWLHMIEKGVIQGAKDLGHVLSKAFGQSLKEAAVLLQSSGLYKDIGEVADALYAGYNLGKNDLQTLADALPFTPKLVFGAIYHVYGDLGRGALVEALYKSGVEDALSVAEAISDTITSTPTEVAAWFKDGPFAPDKVVNALRYGTRLGGRAHELIDYQISKAMHDADIAATVTGKGLDEVYQYGHDRVARALKLGTYDAKQAASYFKEAIGEEPKQIMDILKAGGFHSKDVRKAFEELGGKLKHFAEDVWDKLNPLNW